MKTRLITTLFATGAVLVVLSAQAHDPKEFDKMMGLPKPVPTTCIQLADAHNFSTDATTPEIKALKAKCDAEKGAPVSDAKPMDGAKNKTK